MESCKYSWIFLLSWYQSLVFSCVTCAVSWQMDGCNIKWLTSDTNWHGGMPEKEIRRYSPDIVRIFSCFSSQWEANGDQTDGCKGFPDYHMHRSCQDSSGSSYHWSNNQMELCDWSKNRAYETRSVLLMQHSGEEFYKYEIKYRNIWNSMMQSRK